VLRAAVAEVRPDVVVGSGGRVLWLAAPVARAARVPFVAVVHGTELGGRRWAQALTRLALRQATSIVAVSRFTAALTADLGIRSPVTVVPNGADAERFAPDAGRRDRFRRAHGLGGRPVVLTVGNVTERKGQHVVVDALPRLVAAVPDVLYVVVGRPTEAAALEARARRLGVADHLLVVGQLDAEGVADAHAAADVFAMTSTTTGSGDVEGYGIAVVEAALTGVPSVVSRGTGAEEAVIHDVTGLAVPAEPVAVADALGSLLSDDERRRRMGDAAHRAARTSGSWSHRVERYGEVLDAAARPDHEDRPPADRPRIVVVSHTEHHRAGDGSVVGFGPTLREIDQLATLASELVHVVPLHPGPAPANALAPRAANVRTVTVPAAGGRTAVAKLRAVLRVPGWAATIRREVAAADVVHVRCPAGISMVALAVLALRRRPRDRWVKYAGSWRPPQPDSRTYGWQRWWLRRGLARATVTVNGTWPGDPPWVRSFDNPTLTDAELEAGRAAARDRPTPPPWRVVFAGRVEEAKGADVVVDVVTELVRRGHDVHLELVGDGPLADELRARCARDLPGRAVLHGWMSRAELEEVLARGHLLLLPSRSEGFPKVVAEALAFGCVPVASDVSAVGQVLAETGGGLAVPPGEPWVDAVEALLTGGRWADLAATGPRGAARFGYGRYLERVQQMAREDWGRDLAPAPAAAPTPVSAPFSGAGPATSAPPPGAG
jgi:glycosyltransferase involved in cell wall biosynthesis